jgi:lauroyl/myristoyl acyltransferase
MVRNRALYLGLRVGARVLPAVPLRLSYALASLAGWIAYYVVIPARAGILANLAVALPQMPARTRCRVARAAFQHDAKNWIDTLRISRLPDDELGELVAVVGWEQLSRALERGRGAILVSMHLGNFDLVGQILAARGLTVTVPVERMEPPELFDLLTRQRESRGIHTFPLDRAPRALVRALGRREVVGLTADRHLAGRAVCVPFFGRPAQLPRAPVALARATQAPVLFALGLRLPDNRFQAIFRELGAPADDPAAGRDEEAAMRPIVGMMEEFVRRYPGQWMAFSPVWRPCADMNTPATMDQQIEAAL